MIRSDWRSQWPHLAALLAFLLITLLFFSPLLEGKVIRQHDLLTFEGASKEIVDLREQHDYQTLWTSRMFGGMPAYQISTEYPSNLVSYIHYDLLVRLFVHPASIIFLCMVGFYILLLSYGVQRVISAIGAFAFAFSTYFIVIIQAGHNTKGYAIAYMAPIIAGIITAYRGKILLGTTLTALALALQLIANHLQITYYTVFLVITIGLAELTIAIKAGALPRFFRTSGLLLVAALVAVAANITPLLLTYEYGEETIRGKSELTDNPDNKTTGLDRDYAYQYSYGVGETMSLMVPNFKGGKSDLIGNNETALEAVDSRMRRTVANMIAYFGEQPSTSGNIYVGAIVIFLFVLSLFFLHGPLKWALLIVTAISIMLSWGRHFQGFSDFFMDYFPLYNKFRTVSMILVIPEFTIPLLGFMLFQKIYLNPEVLLEKRRAFYLSFGLTGGLCMLMLVMPDAFNSYFKPGEIEMITQQATEAQFPPDAINQLLDGLETARKKLYTADAMRSFIFILLGAALLFFYAKKQLGKTALLVGMGALIFFDLWVVNKRFINEQHFVAEAQMKREFTKTPADDMILQDPDPNYRVLNTTVSTFNDATTSYYHKSIGGYHGAKLRRYQELIERHISNNNMAVLNMLNTKYVIVADQNGAPMAQVNQGALGHAWFVDSLRWVPDADAEIAALSSFNPSSTAIIDQRFRDVISINGGPKGSVQLSEYYPDRLTYSTNTNAPSFLVFSEIYYNNKKGWQAYLDGNPTNHVRVNYVLRGMEVPAGSHTIEFHFEPPNYSFGENISMAGSVVLLAAFAFALVRQLTHAGTVKK